MDFKIGDDIEESGSSSSKIKKNSKLPIIIVVIVSILVGLLVFFTSNSLFGGKKTKEEVPSEEKLSLNETNVEILYSYVTYGVKNTRAEKFIKEDKVTLSSFTNEEKFYYALQFADVEDFVPTGEVNEKNQKTYLIKDYKIKNYMQRFFGKDVEYDNDEQIKYPFSFRINGQNVGIMNYSEEYKGYITVFDGYEKDVEDTNIIEPYYATLSAAYKENDGTYRLEEKIIYTELEKSDDNTYSLSIYRDYDHKMLLEKKSALTEDDLKDKRIDIKDYQNHASTITYKFALNGNILYFDSSSIKHQ